MDEKANEFLAKIFLIQCIITNRYLQQILDKAYLSSHGRPRVRQASQYQSGYVDLNLPRVMLRRAYPGDRMEDLFHWRSENYVVMNDEQFLIQDGWVPSQLTGRKA